MPQPSRVWIPGGPSHQVGEGTRARGLHSLSDQASIWFYFLFHPSSSPHPHGVHHALGDSSHVLDQSPVQTPPGRGGRGPGGTCSRVLLRRAAGADVEGPAAAVPGPAEHRLCRLPGVQVSVLPTLLHTPSGPPGPAGSQLETHPAAESEGPAVA